MAATRHHRYDNDMSFTKVDLWIGKTLFVPPIVKLCQLTRQTQYAVSRMFWFFAALDGFYHAETLFGSVLWGGLSVIMMVSAAWRPDVPTRSMMFFRLLAMGALIVDLLMSANTGEWGGVEFWVFVLAAEYAATIRTIPPRRSKEVRAHAANTN